MTHSLMHTFIVLCRCYSVNIHMTTPVITLWHIHQKSLTTFVSTMNGLIELMFILKVIRSHFKWSYDKQNLTLVVILYEIYFAYGSFIYFICNDQLCKILYVLYSQVFWMWIMNSIYHSILLFWMPVLALQQGKMTIFSI